MDKIFVSVSFEENTDWDDVIAVVDKFKDAHSFSFSKAVYYSGDYATAEIFIAELSKLGYKMKIMRNVD